jgi:hypothetical protein
VYKDLIVIKSFRSKKWCSWGELGFGYSGTGILGFKVWMDEA